MTVWLLWMTFKATHYDILLGVYSSCEKATDAALQHEASKRPDLFKLTITFKEVDE